MVGGNWEEPGGDPETSSGWCKPSHVQIGVEPVYSTNENMSVLTES